MPSEISNRHKKHSDKLLRMDYEILNSALGLELNLQLDPHVIRHVIRQRFTELTREEKNELPQGVIDIVKAIQGENDPAFNKYAKGKKSSTPVKVTPGMRITRPTEDMVEVQIAGKTAADIVKDVVGNHMWASWSYYNAAKINATGDTVTITSNAFTDANEDDVARSLKALGL